jgi:Flp pilus assembly protein TadG
MVLLTPAALTLLAFAIGTGRLVSARLDVADAAHQAARTASLARTSTGASMAARSAATDAIAADGRACSRLSVTADTSAFRPGGQVSVTVACTADLADLTALPWPGTHTVTQTFTAPLETYRAGERP